MKNKGQTQISNNIQNLALEIFKIYNTAVRTPANWKEERERLLKSPNSRAAWNYQVPDSISGLKTQLIRLKKEFDSVAQKDSTDMYLKFLPDIVDATVQTALTKCQILSELKRGDFNSSLNLRKQFYSLNYDYTAIEKTYLELAVDPKNKQIGKILGSQTTPAIKAAEIVKQSIKEVQQKIENVIPLLPKFKNKILDSFTTEVEVVDDPSFSMRCITDPKTLTTKVLLNKRRKYSPALLKIAYLHEFCGHALEMAVFDKILVKDNYLPAIYSYAGVSSPNIFDVKAEVFADLIVVPFIDGNEYKYVQFRRNVWLVCRAMADYLYNIQGKNIVDVMRVYEKVGLQNFAFDEAIMSSIFLDGYQGMYLFANQKIEELQKKLALSNKDLLTLLLYMGKIPVDKLEQFKKEFTLNKFNSIRRA